jgi:hypothetical protein
LLTRARAIEPWDPEVCIDLARLYIGTDQVEVALELLASLAERVSGRELRRARALRWRITLSFRDGWLWLRALVTARRTRSDKLVSALPNTVKDSAAGICDVTQTHLTQNFSRNSSRSSSRLSEPQLTSVRRNAVARPAS